MKTILLVGMTALLLDLSSGMPLAVARSQLPMCVLPATYRWPVASTRRPLSTSRSVRAEPGASLGGAGLSLGQLQHALANCVPHLAGATALRTRTSDGDHSQPSRFLDPFPSGRVLALSPTESQRSVDTSSRQTQVSHWWQRRYSSVHRRAAI